MAPAGATTNVSGGIAGVYYDLGADPKYGSKANGTNWCATDGADGIISTTPAVLVQCVISETKAADCTVGCGTGGAAGQAGADLEVQAVLRACSTAEP